MARTAGKNAADWPLRWDLLLRYRLIEVIALWEGRLTTNHLQRAFGIGRQQASKDINTILLNMRRPTWFTTAPLRATSPPAPSSPYSHGAWPMNTCR